MTKVHDNRFWTLFFNAFRLRCPVCKEGKIFPGWIKLAQKCPVCGVDIQRERGYFLGAIYFNYGATALIECVIYMVGLFVFELSNRVLLPVVIAFAIIFPVYFLRYAWASWLVFDQYFDPRLPPSDVEKTEGAAKPSDPPAR